MRAPAAAVLLLAALTALPCRASISNSTTTFKVQKGTDADASRLANETHNSQTQPIITKLYRMLHISSLNETKPYNNYSTIHFNFYDDANETTEFNQTKCCVNSSIAEKRKDMRVNESKRDRKRRVVYVRSEETTPSPMTMERKRKPGETGSSAPLLNYIFDTYSNTHQHHRNDKVGTGSGIYAAGALEIEALVGSTAHLDCKVDALHDKLVSWVRRKSDEDPMELLYTGTQQYTADDRYSSKFIPPDIWRLEVKEVRASDAAHYDCQMPTHPPRAARVTLRVPEVSVLIVDGAGAKVTEQVCELGSTVALRCEVRGLKMEGGPSLLWYRKDDLLNDDTTRGGISVRTEFGSNGANSVLRVARVRGDDAGRYTCTVARAPPPGPPPAHVILHVIKGESLAELHQGDGSLLASTFSFVAILSLSVLLHNIIILN